MRPHGQEVGSPHSPATAQITLGSVKRSAFFYQVRLLARCMPWNTPSNT